MNATRRTFLESLAVLPIAAVNLPDLPNHAQPEPLSSSLLRLDGTSTVVRVWDGKDVARCRLCPRHHCSAVHVRGIAYCGVITNDPALAKLDVDASPGALDEYDAHHLEFTTS